MPARKLAQILNESPELRALAELSQRTDQLQRVYREAVPVELSKSSRIGWARAGILSVSAGNGAVAAKLRQLAPRILNHLRQRGIEFNSMRIEVQVELNPLPSPIKSHRPLTNKALAAIRQAHEQLPESPLKDALARLGRNRGAGLKRALEHVEKDQDHTRDHRQSQHLQGKPKPTSIAGQDESE